MDALITVTTPRTDDGLLVSLDALKTELQITDASEDEYLTSLLKRGSQAVEAHCGRVFAIETVTETVRPDGDTLRALRLSRYPVIAIESITIDDVALDADEYEADLSSGLLYRLQSDARTLWTGVKIVAVYSAGYEMIPGPVQQGVFEAVKLAQAARTRDPALRSENILEGLYSYTLFNGENLQGVFGAVPGLDTFIDRKVM